MKSPTNLRMLLRRQWEVATTRESRLLGVSRAWPIVLSIGKPKPRVMAYDIDSVKRHVDEWRHVNIGEVIWESTSYRATANPVEMPVYWKLRQPTEWIAACSDHLISEEFESMSVFVEHTDVRFHSLLIRRRSLWRDKSLNEVLQACRLSVALKQNSAEGKPLRFLSLEGIDTKFFERNCSLITALLDKRFDGEVSRIGLETFLGAVTDCDHWLLVMDLDGTLLPFRKQRVRSSELKDTQLPSSRLLIVENESCQHQLPHLMNTIAVLGSGFDLGWIQANWLQTKRVGYWGDIDTWGLKFLAKVRQALPHVDAILMTSKVYEENIESAVSEPVIAGTDLPDGLNPIEQSLYRRLLSESRGRLEQEFLTESCIDETLRNWCVD
ncbi:MAG TPA: hypothetical protein DD473_15365 [Planctomycetaceae bacterium]|nr:hypothetical protein [Planctomycetaceae bacterium]|tara:strand:- start:39 stop:1184 length:1146 start_codon:yes stop_codon:yes gene_type:complete